MKTTDWTQVPDFWQLGDNHDDAHSCTLRGSHSQKIKKPHTTLWKELLLVLNDN